MKQETSQKKAQPLSVNPQNRAKKWAQAKNTVTKQKAKNWLTHIARTRSEW